MYQKQQVILWLCTSRYRSSMPLQRQSCFCVICGARKYSAFVFLHMGIRIRSKNSMLSGKNDHFEVILRSFSIACFFFFLHFVIRVKCSSDINELEILHLLKHNASAAINTTEWCSKGFGSKSISFFPRSFELLHKRKNKCI